MDGNVIESKDRFQHWLVDMDDALERFLGQLPADLSAQLDYSPKSLSALEGWLLSQYASPDAMVPMSEAQRVDGAARYVGEVFRKSVGGKWAVELDDRRNAYFGLPQLTAMPGQRAQLCPLTLVTASTDRRTGTFLQTVYANNERNADAAKRGPAG